MQLTKVLYGHNLVDLVSEDQLFDVADLNGIGITDTLNPGLQLSVPKQIKPSLVDDSLGLVYVKPKTVKAIAGQNWIDIALQETGDESKLFELVDLNNAGITDEVDLGAKLTIPKMEPERQKVVNTFSVRKPSSMFFGTGNLEPDGIEYWSIEIDFIVN